MLVIPVIEQEGHGFGLAFQLELDEVVLWLEDGLLEESWVTGDVHLIAFLEYLLIEAIKVGDFPGQQRLL